MRPSLGGRMELGTQAHAGAGSKVIVSTPDDLQKTIDLIHKKLKGDPKYDALCLVVSSLVPDISYHISGLVKRVYVGVCGALKTGEPNLLRIGSDSTYSDHPVYAWDRRAGQLRDGRHKISHEEGCYFDLSDRVGRGAQLLRQPAHGALNDRGGAGRRRDQFARFNKDVSSARPSRSSRPGPFAADGRAAATWFGKWIALLARSLGTGEGPAGAGLAVWSSAARHRRQGAAGAQSVGRLHRPGHGWRRPSRPRPWYISSVGRRLLLSRAEVQADLELHPWRDRVGLGEDQGDGPAPSAPGSTRPPSLASRART